MPAATPATSAVRPRSAPRLDRKQDILLVAERLFAQRGYHAVSIRQIADEARVPLALVGYYYGQKHELFAAIFEHWRPTLEQRLSALAQVGRNPGGGDPVREILAAFIGPVIRLRASSEGEYYALLVARELYQSNPEADRVMAGHFDPLAHAFIDALSGALPHASRGQIAWCYQFALGALLHHISDRRVERLSRGANRAADPGAAPLLLDFVSGGIHAALPSPAARTTTRRSPRRAANPTPTPMPRRHA